MEFSIPLHKIEELVQENSTVQLKRTFISELIYKFRTDQVIQSISVSQQETNNKPIECVSFGFEKNSFSTCVISEIVKNPQTFWKYNSDNRKKKIIIEYSSPNIAKPFHIGHLRSTIIGNFIANIHEAFDYDVLRLNYLGDWGTQFGLLQVGLEESKFKIDNMQHNTMRSLFDIYVEVNKLAEGNEEISERARLSFNRLEQGHSKEVDVWKTLRNYTIMELQRVYSRLGITFDEYHGESMYNAKDIKDVIETLKSKDILTFLPNGQGVVESHHGKNITIIKSDGSTLYLTRDIAAVLDRQSRYNFNRLYYVVDNAQSDHFAALIHTIAKLSSETSSKMRHVKYGRILGMSTRKGKVVFLQDVLDEAKTYMLNRQQKTQTTRYNETIDIPDILGITTLVVNDLKVKRQRDYTFEWKKVIQNSSDSGIRLQYTHSRLCSLEKNCGFVIDSNCNTNILQEKVALELISDLARYEDVLKKSFDELESCYLVNFLFHLCRSINGAFKQLQVKNQKEEVAQARLLLFHAARLVLRNGMIIVGLHPLEEM